jgi:hypothetical protein
VGGAQAISKGQAYCLVELQVGLDPKAVQEAWTAVQAAHPNLALIVFTADAGASASPFPTGTHPCPSSVFTCCTASRFTG